jgi:lipase chaperone LimK
MASRRVAAIIGGAAALIAIAIGGSRAHRADPPAGTEAAATASQASAGTRAGVRGSAAAGEGRAPEALPSSLDGTEADGNVQAGPDGHLIVTLELRRLFDHFLAATGEEPIATIRARIISALRARLPATAAGEAIVILDRYLGYREAARRLAGSRADDADPIQLAAQRPTDDALAQQQVAELARVHDLRAQWFAPVVVQAFFAAEEAVIYAAFARRDVMADKTLSEAARAQKLAELEATLPVADRAARAAALAPLEAMNREAEMRAAGATADQIAAARTAAFGEGGAARLADLDQAHAAWAQKLAQFRADRAGVLGDPSLSATDRDQRIADLVARSFTPQEQIRVAAIEHLPAAQLPR